jgi:hypothetical protein
MKNKTTYFKLFALSKTSEQRRHFRKAPPPDGLSAMALKDGLPGLVFLPLLPPSAPPLREIL